MSTDILLRVFPDLLFTYYDRSLLVAARDGDITDGLEGLYWHDMRILSRYRLLVNGNPPRLDSLSAVDIYSTLGYYVCAPTSKSSDQHDALGLSSHEVDRQVVIRVARSIGEGLHEDLEITNHGLTPAHLELAWELDADFADIFEARDGERRQEAPIKSTWRLTPDGKGELRFDYQHPQLNRGTLLHFNTRGAAPRYEEGKVFFTLNLEPQQSHHICFFAKPIVDGEIREPIHDCDAFGAIVTDTDKLWREYIREGTHLETRNSIVQLAWDRAVSDLGKLALGEGETPVEKIVPAAGLPLYATLFGRDALTLAGQSLLLSPRLAEGALRLLARYVGDKDSDFYDEQPGRVPQQVRDSPLALLGLTPWMHDYGDYAAPCAYLVLLGGYHLAIGDTERIKEFLEPARRVLDWLETRADIDGDGFLEYKTRSAQGQVHQGWKDSTDAVRYEDGRDVEPPVAPCEIQGYWYAAKLLMAEVFLAIGEPSRSFSLLKGAADLKRRFNDKFWMPDEGFFAFALDSEKRQVKSIASNVAHCLATGIIEHKYARTVVQRLMQPDMFSGWGIRTLSSDHPAYNPLKYHLGSVWPVENATTAFGMKRYGFSEECNIIAKGIFDASTLFEHRRLPETFGGHPRDAKHPHPGIYPDACAPQGWSASAVMWLVQAMLGLWTYGPLNVVIVEPDLPAWLPELTLHGLPAGTGRVTIRFKRDRKGKTDFKVLKRKGNVHVLRQPPPDDLEAGPITRVRELVESLLPGH